MSDELRARRAVLAGAGATAIAAVLAGCTVYGATADEPPVQAPPPREPAPAASGSASAAPVRSAQGGGKELAKAADIPVGAGKVFGEDGIVVTQPQAGVFKAFSATCTHQGCIVESISNGTINCPCHGSAFRVVDGSVASGPARRSLAEKKIVVEDGAVKLA
jgi:Rieske Fe-S protein